jgi:hypothetical protein
MNADDAFYNDDLWDDEQDRDEAGDEDETYEFEDNF